MTMRPKTNITTEMIALRNKVLVKVSELTGVPTDDIMSANRHEDTTMARRLTAWALCDLCLMSTTQTGVLLRRHYSSILFLKKQLTYWHLTAEVQNWMKDITNYINSYYNERKRN